MNRQMIQHPFPPLYDHDSRILILGSFPSVRSREQLFFAAAVMGDTIPETIEEKKAFLSRNHIALWDVIASCEITGSSDASIKNVTPNNLTPIFEAADIEAVYTNGGKSYEMYQKYQFPVTGREAVKLPSTSPANAAWHLDRLIDAWRVIRTD